MKDPFVIRSLLFLSFFILFANLLQMEDLTSKLAGAADVENYKENLYMLYKTVPLTNRAGGVLGC